MTRKGQTRWLAILPMGSSLDTADTKLWLVVNTLASTTSAPVAVGKYDGATVPTP